MVKAKDYEALSGGSIPVKVDRDDHTKVAIDWDALRGEFELAKQERRLALATQSAVGDPVTAAGGTPVVDLTNDPELREKIEQVLGRKLTPGTTEQVAAGDPMLQAQIMQVVQQHMAEQAGSTWSVGGVDPGQADTIGQLERLAALRAQGVLTDEEFEAQKQKLLGA